MSAEALSPEQLERLRRACVEGVADLHADDELRGPWMTGSWPPGFQHADDAGKTLLATVDQEVTTERNRLADELEAALSATERPSNTSAGELEHLRQTVADLATNLRKENPNAN